MATVMNLKVLHQKMKSGKYAAATVVVQITKASGDIVYEGYPVCSTAWKAEENEIAQKFCGSCKIAMTETAFYYRLKILIQDASVAHWSTPCSDCATALLGVPASKFQELSAAKKDKPLFDAMKKTFWVLRVDVGTDNSQKPFLRVLKVEGKSSDMPVATERSGESMLDEVLNDFTPKSARHFQTTMENPMYSMSESLAESISSPSVRRRASSGSSLRTGKRNVSGKTRDNGKQRVDAEVPLPESPKKNVSDVASQTIVETAKPTETSVSTSEGPSNFVIGYCSGVGSGIICLLLLRPDFCAGFFVGISFILCLGLYYVMCKLKETNASKAE